MIKRYINKINSLSKTSREWTWFIILWFSGLFAVLTLSYTIKLLMGM